MIPPIVAYVPVVHQGYLTLFRKYPERLFILDTDVLASVLYLIRDVRACTPAVVAPMVRALNIFSGGVNVASVSNLHTISSYPKIIMPDEDISREVAGRFFREGQVQFEQVFLRWNKQNVTSEMPPDTDVVLTNDAFHREILSHADVESNRSSDWWRQVGACVVRDGRILLTAHNTHFPSEHTPYIVGDPRTPFQPGERIDVSSASHAERILIGEAARHGTVLEGADLYVTTFPCPHCAMQIAVSGFNRVFFRDGYSLVGAQEILKSGGVKVFRITS